MTPGTITDEALLNQNEENLVVALSLDTKGSLNSQGHSEFGIAILDMSSGRFSVLQAKGEDALFSELQRLCPAELLISEDSNATLFSTTCH